MHVEHHASTLRCTARTALRSPAEGCTRGHLRAIETLVSQRAVAQALVRGHVHVQGRGEPEAAQGLRLRGIGGRHHADLPVGPSKVELDTLLAGSLAPCPSAIGHLLAPYLHVLRLHPPAGQEAAKGRELAGLQQPGLRRRHRWWCRSHHVVYAHLVALRLREVHGLGRPPHLLLQLLDLLKPGLCAHEPQGAIHPCARGLSASLAGRRRNRSGGLPVAAAPVARWLPEQSSLLGGPGSEERRCGSGGRQRACRRRVAEEGWRRFKSCFGGQSRVRLAPPPQGSKQPAASQRQAHDPQRPAARSHRAEPPCARARGRGERRAANRPGASAA
mmetsp:Transcript_37452/g.101396  ORF Transcript_37452/g.101396 Transcript_37452/m.101396 type:complete len:331 (-) Transcript_37452:3-995(-)